MMMPQECELPVIDLSQQGAEERIFWAVKEYGLVQVVDHGIRSELLAKTTGELVKLFGTPVETKAHRGLLNNSYHWGTPIATSSTQFSWPEAFHVPFMKIHDPSCYGPFISLRELMMELGPAMSRLARMLAGVLAKKLGHQGCSMFNDICDDSTCFLRLNHYPVCPLSPETFRPVPHVDSDFLTVLYPDQVGGIRLRKDSRWVVVRPNRGALVVSIGDLLQAWSNDVYRSMERKVQINSEVERYSVAFSLCPSPDSQIGNYRKPSVYRKFTFGEYREKGRIYGLPHFRQTERVDVSTELVLQNDPWMIMKELTISDLNDLSWLLLPLGCLKAHVFPQMDEEMLRQVVSKEGMQVVGMDVDTGCKHWFVFRRWGSSRSYVLNGGWTKEFVEKKRLKVGDQIGMVWFMSSRMFYFKVFHRAAA
ncbi:gibberellin 2-beta-dioxygenase 6-like [Eucalyptus grandis]|uniref:gibberellin 2-beta-dioxygenase 6-like n=1 Tax=Eucalyptus grandis TaxID=71139 RepID=UPI00192E97EC|nr:gibberellin 2-beta-dioxygenase 6-like [Eucalyptus grandis]